MNWWRDKDERILEYGRERRIGEREFIGDWFINH